MNSYGDILLAFFFLKKISFLKNVTGRVSHFAPGKVKVSGPDKVGKPH